MRSKLRVATSSSICANDVRMGCARTLEMGFDDRRHDLARHLRHARLLARKKWRHRCGTGVAQARTLASAQSNTLYDLSGRRANGAASHGVYIRDGKRVALP